jgi:nucleoside-diphosphate-sugar epimerase
MARFTVFGSNGFIGRHLVRQLRRSGHEVYAATRSAMPKRGTELGHAITCIGITANFRNDPAGTVEAQVTALGEILNSYSAGSFLYLSSTRVYGGAAGTSEKANLSVMPGLDHLYNLTKLTGEAMVLAQKNPAFRAVRLSNVIGPGEKPVMFLPSVSDEARRAGKVLFRTAPDSTKDYVAVEDAVAVIEQIALRGKHRLYNVASGINTTNEEIAALVRKYLAAETVFAPDAPATRFPVIDVSRVREEFQFSPRPFAQAYARALEPELSEETA